MMLSSKGLLCQQNMDKRISCNSCIETDNIILSLLFYLHNPRLVIEMSLIACLWK